MECLKTGFMATLDACAHLLSADVATLEQLSVMVRQGITYDSHKLPARLWYLLNVLYRLLERCIAKRYFGYPHGAEQMCPFHRIGLFESPIHIWTEYAALQFVSRGSQTQDVSTTFNKQSFRLTGWSFMVVPRPTN
jgi:hypothetical protein